MTDPLEAIRQFNRTVTRRLGILNQKYLGRDRPLVESRLLFEIGAHGAPIRALRERLGLDSGYLSRLLRALEHKGLATSSRQAGADARAKFVRLTRSGQAELRRINARSDDLARSMLKPLSPAQGTRLVSAMSQVERLLCASAIEIHAADAADREAQCCLGSYFQELRARFPEGYDGDVDGAADLDEFRLPNGAFVVARLFGRPVGCGALRTVAPRIGEIKRVWVAPELRGLGLGRRLLAALEGTAGKRRIERLRLDTHESLTEAQSLYRSAGYREIAPFNANPYAHHWFEKSLEGSHAGT
jgi:DNA-binding MarR family transcriptional regulator/GNAT superfamily N-acetyltransferase